MTAAAAGRCGAGLLLSAAFASGAVHGQEDAPPGDALAVGLTEQVEVELVLVDFLVLDAQGANVPGLTADDFTLKVGGRKTPIVSVDVDCRTGHPAQSGRDRTDAGAVGAGEGEGEGEPRRIVLVFDYFHISNVAETIDRALAMLDRWPAGDEIHTVISLGRAVRVEAPPTADLGDVRWALQRMRSDPDLYAESQASLTQYRFFDRMKALFDLVEQVPGRKSIVLFSGPFQPDAFLHDPEYNELSGLSTTTRTSIYPVDTGGLRTDFDRGVRPLGGPLELRRLANNTGGRMTADTNDIGRAYARAHHDLGCTYTLGFYNDEPRLDKKRRLTLKVRRPDTRVVYPEFFLERSPVERHRSMFATATMAPHMFESDGIAADLFVLGPGSTSSWSTVLAVEIRLAPGRLEDVELRGFLRKPNGTVVHDFKKKIPPDDGDLPRTVSFFQEIDVEPGRYVVSAVVSDPAEPTPRAATRSAQLVRIPDGAPFLIGPLLIRAAAAPAPGERSGRESEIEPLLAPEAARGDAVRSLTLLCVAGAEAPVVVSRIARRVTAADGATIRDFNTDSAELPGRGRAHCERFLDAVPTSSMAPGLYEVSASATTPTEQLDGSAVEFTIRPGPE